MSDPGAFETHLFISYAHLDNQPLEPDQLGWVSRFHASLEAMLSMRMGRKARIWRDKKLDGNDVFADEILSQIPKSAILISVLTPRYIQSDWCAKEAWEFCRLAEQRGNLLAGNKSRVVKVLKLPVDSEEPLPPIMKATTGYPFYVYDEETPLELDSTYGPEMAQKYNLKVAKLAWDLAQLIKNLGVAGEAEKTPDAGTAKPAVYLAECSYDRREAREALEAELRLHNYPVHPDRPLPREEEEYVREVERLLEGCKLSIHLIGSGYGAVPDGPSQKSVVVLQNELAIRRSRSAGLPRLVWLSAGTESPHQQQQNFISALHNDAECQFGADLITDDLETLKGAVHAALQKLERPAAPPFAPTGATGARMIFLICDETDRKATIPLRKFLKGKGFEVSIPVFEGDAAAVRQSNQDSLTRCDAVILFYGAGDEAWKRTVESDLRKAQAYRGDKPLLAVYTYLSEPATDDKRDSIELEERNLITGLTGFSESQMLPFLKVMEA